MPKVTVECYSGYKGDERPLRIMVGKESHEIADVEDRWYSPGETYFRVRLNSGDRYVLKRIDAQDSWSIESYRRDAN